MGNVLVVLLICGVKMEHSQECINWCKRGIRRKISTSKTVRAATKVWKFRVRAPELHKAETICITGDAEELGSWESSKIILLYQEGTSNFWSADVNIPSETDVFFRYCTCIVVNTTSPVTVIVRKWETHIEPRVIKTSQTTPPDFDILGEIENSNKYENGWLPAGKVYQFRIPENSVSLLNKPNIRVKLTPLFSDFKCIPGNATEFFDSKEPDNVITEVANQNGVNPRFFIQEETGHTYTKDDYLVFNVTVPIDEINNYSIKIYDNTSDSIINFGYSNILTTALKNSKGSLQVPILCTFTNFPIGYLDINYLIVQPMVGAACDMSISYSNYWNSAWSGLEVGHRGMGASFKVMEANIKRENTIGSFTKAGVSGADMVEFDVQLSKDLVPVIYHDFNLCLISKNKIGGDYPDMVQMPMQELTRQQLQEMRIYHVAESKLGVFTFDEVTPEPFPLLSEVFEEVDPSIGFNVEIKWPLTNINGKSELDHPMDLNLYLDRILAVLLRFKGERKVVISCFDPDVCTSLRFKQNYFAVMFLTEGAVIEVKQEDSRCNSTPSAVNFALNASLLGVVTNSKDLLRDLTLIQLVREAGLRHFCWGGDNNNKDVINQMKAAGLDGIIFDKMDVYSTKPKKVSIFKSESGDS